MEKIKYLLLILSLVVFTSAQKKVEPMECFTLNDVRLYNSPFGRAQQNNFGYLMELDEDRLLAPFLREAGLEPKAESYPNWENTGLDGQTAGHYLSALAMMYASTDNENAKNMVGSKIDYVIAELKRVQDANGNGYIGGVPGSKQLWDEIAKGDIRASGFGLNNKWVPLYNIHKTYAGLRDVWVYTDNPLAKSMFLGMVDWMAKVTSGLTDEQMQDMLRSEHGGLNEIFADAAAISGDPRYLELAKRFSHREILDPLLAGKDNLTGRHANTQIPKVIGFERIAKVGNEPTWDDAAEFFWQTVTQNRSVVIGGNSVSEHFNPTDDFSKMTVSVEGPETCNTYNMLKLTRMLYEKHPNTNYVDFYERALYNHILSTQHPETGGFVYFTPMRSGHYRVYSQPQTSFWCCVGSGLENHAKYGEMIYAHRGNDLYVNLFIPSDVDWDEKGVSVIQSNNFPEQPSTTLKIGTAKPIRFTMNVRVPAWVASNPTVKVNGKPIKTKIVDGYIAIDRKWVDSDIIEVQLPMEIRIEQMPDNSPYYAICYGPVVLAADMGHEDIDGLFADDSRRGHIALGPQIPLKDMPIFVGDAGDIIKNIEPVEGKPLTFRFKGLQPEKYSAGVELIPFYKICESRYVIYWPQATPEQMESTIREQAEAEQKTVALDKITVDKVVCGEQQPESDHFVEFDRSTTGFIENTHWREAQGWFSYKMRNPKKQNVKLMLKMYDFDTKRVFNVEVNGTVVAQIVCEGVGGANIIERVIELNSEASTAENLVVKFVAEPNYRTTKITEVRLIRSDAN